MRHGILNRTTTRPRGAIRAILLMLALISVSCASDSVDEAVISDEVDAAAPETTTPETTTTSIAVDAGSTEDWPTAVSRFLTFDNERQEIMFMAGALACCVEGRPDVAQWQFRCDWVDDQAELALDARPDASPDAGDSWVTYIDLVESFWTQYRSTCERFNADGSILDTEPEFAAQLFETESARLEACKALLIDLEPLPNDAPVAFCESPLNTAIEIESFSDLPEDLEAFLNTGEGPGGIEEESEISADLDPTEQPTDMQLALLEPGSGSFEWFQPVFSFTNDIPWLVESQSDHISLFDGPEMPPNATIELLGPGGIADPSDIVAGEDWTTGPIPTIPVPDDLTAWVEEMPLIGTPTPTVIGSVDATYWKLEYDREAPGNDVVIYAYAELDGAIPVGIEEPLHLWHVARPDGALLIVERDNPEDSSEDLMAPQFFEYFSFE